MSNAFLNNYNIFDQIFNDFFEINSSFKYETQPFPHSNVYLDEETKDAFFELALAGYSKKDIQISFENDRMIVKGDIEKQSEDKKVILKKGIKLSKFTSKFIVPFSKYDVEKSVATFNDGILEIMIPAKEEAKPKLISIR